jgi:hypothetical protein
MTGEPDRRRSDKFWNGGGARVSMDWMVVVYCGQEIDADVASEVPISLVTILVAHATLSP